MGSWLSFDRSPCEVVGREAEDAAVEMRTVLVVVDPGYNGGDVGVNGVVAGGVDT